MDKVRNKFKLGFAGIMAIFGVMLIANLINYFNLSNQEIKITTQENYISDTSGGCEVSVYNTRTLKPLEAEVSLRVLDDKKKLIKNVFEGKTNEFGGVSANFDIPREWNGEYYFDFRVSSQAGYDKIIKKINIVDMSSISNITINLDKPLYKPGDEVNFRALLTDSKDDCPVVADAIVSIADGKKNTVFKKTLKSSQYGIIGGSFELGEKVNSGTYKIKVEFDTFATEKEFEVKPYVLPKFSVALKTEKNKYLIGEEIKGSIKATYFFGQPVDQGEVRLKINGQSFKELNLNSEGGGDFSFKADTEGEQKIEAEVVDSSNYLVCQETIVYSAKTRVQARMVPESGKLVPGVENEVYVFTSGINGEPLKSYIKLGGDLRKEIMTDENGIARFTVHPDISSGNVYKVDALIYNEDQTISEEFSFELPEFESRYGMIIRADKPLYNQNDKISLNIISNIEEASTRIFVSKNGQVVKTINTDNEQVDIELPEDTYGLLSIYAERREHSQDPGSRNSSEARMVSSQKSIFVKPHKKMTIDVVKDNRAYKPGEDVNISFNIKDNNNNPLNSALCLSILDEAILALGNNDLSIDNIRMALAHAKLDKEINGIDLYTAILSNVSPTTLEALLIDQSEGKPRLDETKYDNKQKKKFVLTSFWWWMIFTILSAIIFMLIMFRWFRISAVYYTTYMLLFVPAFIAALIVSVILMMGLGVNWLAVVVLSILLSSCLYTLIAKALSAPLKSGNKIPAISGIMGFISIATIVVLILFSFTGCGGTFDGGNEAPAPFAPKEWSSDGAKPDYDSKKVQIGNDGGVKNDDEVSDPQTDDNKEVAGSTKKLRSRFLESLYFSSEIIAEDGKASIKIPLADNITSWRMQTAANSLDGYLGSSTDKIDVFQEFFIDFELPKNLKVDDEVGIPVTVFNYSDEPQEVKLTVRKDEWFTLTDGELEKNIKVEAGEQKFFYLPIRINAFGSFRLRIDADGGTLSDAVEKEARVYPKGYKIEEVCTSGKINKNAKEDVFFIDKDIENTRKLWVKLYPSQMSHLVEGMESILSLPNGCFEQTSSSLYPDILVLKYLKDTKTSNPTIEDMAYQYIEKGFQKLLTYEVEGESGGFSLYGSSPAETVLTAYGFMEFNDLKEVYYVDESILNRMKEFLFKKQKADGSFQITGYHVGGASTRDTVALNAYIGWALSKACKDDKRFDKTVEYLKKKAQDVDDNYTLALIANVLVNVEDKGAKDVLDRLVKNVTIEEDTAYLKSNTKDYYGSYGKSQNLQTTALASIALSRQKMNSDINKLMINYIINSKHPSGTFGSTQATILALKALLESNKPVEKDTVVSIKVNEVEKKIEIKAAEALDLYQLEFNNLNKENTVVLQSEEELSFELVKEYYVPYNNIKSGDEFEIKRQIKNSLRVNEEVTENLKIINRRGDSVENLMVTVDVPQGFTVDEESLKLLKDNDVIEEYDISYGSVDFYIRNFDPDEVKSLDMVMRAGYPVYVTTGAVRVYDYYNPGVESVLAPLEIKVVK